MTTSNDDTHQPRRDQQDPDRDGADGDGAEDRSEVLKRGAFTVFFLVAFSLAQSLQILIAIFQFLSLLFAGHPNRYLADFGVGLSEWLAETSRFVTAVSERKPFPWAPWPTAGIGSRE